MVAGTEKFIPSFKREKELIKEGYDYVAGVDEAGLGPLAGPVVAAAVSFNPYRNSSGPLLAKINDSKQLTEQQREELFPVIYNEATQIGVGIVSVNVIDQVNIYWAGRQAMIEAVRNMYLVPKYLLIDGNKPIALDIPQESIVKGDSKSISIAAASIIAKVTRDKLMVQYDNVYPNYGFAAHKGYPTPKHKEAVREHGITPIHRKSFKFIKEILSSSGA